MANAKDGAGTRAIPSAGPDFEHLLAQEVVIEAGEATSGAQAIAPDHSPRAKAGTVDSAVDTLPKHGMVVAGDIQREVEQFLYRQAELLDGKHWQAFIDLFADDGVYWMPVTREQTEWEGSPSIFAEDKLMMESGRAGSRIQPGRRRRCGRPTTGQPRRGRVRVADDDRRCGRAST
jgi:hypothetical protein